MIPAARWLASWQALGRPFAHLPRWAALLVLALLALAMAWSAWHAATANAPVENAGTPAHAAAAAAPERERGDMALYARIAARVAGGEGYHAAALAEHRVSGYPARPFVTIRLPTLARVQALIGVDGVRHAALALAAASLWALGTGLGGSVTWPERLGAGVLLALGAGAAFSPVAGLDHDFIAGMLLTFALLAWRPERWWPALIAAGAALAVRELAAPFVLLWLAVALGARCWREAAAVAAVLGLFAIGLAWHAQAVEAARLPGDLASQGWDARAGYGLPLAALSQLTGLRLLPPALAAPLAVLPLVGWASLGGRIGLVAPLWFAGLATMMALFARPANYYWAELALPAYALGLAFAPRAVIELVRGLSRQS